MSSQLKQPSHCPKLQCCRSREHNRGAALPCMSSHIVETLLQTATAMLWVSGTQLQWAPFASAPQNPQTCTLLRTRDLGVVSSAEPAEEHTRMSERSKSFDAGEANELARRDMERSSRVFPVHTVSACWAPSSARTFNVRPHMWDTSNSDACSRHQMVDSMMLSLYWMGIDQPANGTILPARRTHVQLLSPCRHGRMQSYLKGTSPPPSPWRLQLLGTMFSQRLARTRQLHMCSAINAMCAQPVEHRDPRCWAASGGLMQATI